MQTASPRKFESVQIVADHLGIPAAWLKAEAEAGRIPHLKAGRRLLFNIETVERALLDRAHAEVGITP